jgi:hypothetical protein
LTSISWSIEIYILDHAIQILAVVASSQDVVDDYEYDSQQSANPTIAKRVDYCFSRSNHHNYAGGYEGEYLYKEVGSTIWSYTIVGKSYKDAFFATWIASNERTGLFLDGIHDQAI